LQLLQEVFLMQAKHSLSEDTNRDSVSFMADRERLTETIPAFRVKRSDYETIIKRAKDDRRASTDVVRALLERGIAAMRRDGLLFEPEEESGTSEESERTGSHPAFVSAESRNLLGRKRSRQAK
jgi:hypothetical protein